jgi:hypothetical protein
VDVDDEDDEMVSGRRGGIDDDESAAAVAAELGVLEGGDEETVTLIWDTGTDTLEHTDERADAVGAMTSTLRLTAGTQLRRHAVRTAKRRAVVAQGGDDDDSDDVVFKEFGGRKKERVRETFFSLSLDPIRYFFYIEHCMLLFAKI